jgi:hypothetical protein
MTESGHAASFGIDIIIMASAAGVELAVGAAAVERHDRVCAEAGVNPKQGALAYGSCTQPGVQRWQSCYASSELTLITLSGHKKRRIREPIKGRGWERAVIYQYPETRERFVAMGRGTHVA